MKGLLLISGGIDSPVAGYLMKKEGYEIVPIHFSSSNIVGNEPEEKSIAACKKLGFDKILLVEISNFLKEIAEKCDRKYYFVIMKRVMNKIAEKIAKEKELDFLVTGENLGQVSSQTLQNILVVDKSVKIPIIRPLIAYDKMEIVDIAKEIGTFEISKGPEMCDVLGPKHPSTQAKEEIILQEEKKIKLNNLINNISVKIKRL